MLKTVVFSSFDVLEMFSPNETDARLCTHMHTDAATDVTVKAVHLNVGEGGTYCEVSL